MTTYNIGTLMGFILKRTSKAVSLLSPLSGAPAIDWGHVTMLAQDSSLLPRGKVSIRLFCGNC